MVWAAFLARHMPVSTRAKPACMNMTRKPAISVQTKLMARVCSANCELMSVIEGHKLQALGGGNKNRGASRQKHSGHPERVAAAIKISALGP
jgi:hypothetical protein